MRLKLSQIPDSVDKVQDSGQGEQIGLVLFMFPQKKGSGSVTMFSSLLLLKYRRHRLVRWFQVYDMVIPQLHGLCCAQRKHSYPPAPYNTSMIPQMVAMYFVEE